MTEIAERGVKFVFMAEASPQAKAALDQWAKQIVSAQEAIVASMAKGVDAVAASARESVAAVQQTAAATSTVAGAGGGGAAAVVAERAANADLQQLYAERARIQKAAADKQLATEKELFERVKEARVAAFQVERMLAEANESGATITKAEQAIFDQIIDIWEEAESEWVEFQNRKTKKAEQESAKQLNAAIRDAERPARAVEREAERAARARQQDFERQSAAGRAAMERMAGSGRAAFSAFTEGTEAVMRFTRGIVAAGLVGERDLPKITDALLRMQAVMDITAGGVRVLMQMESIYRNITAAINAARTAQEAFNAAQAIGGAAGLGGAGARGAAGGAGGAVAGGVLGGLAARGGGFVARLGGGALAGVGNAVGGGLAPLGGAGVGVAGGGAAALGGAALGAVGGAAFGLTSAILSLRDAFKYGIGGGATRGSFVESVGTSGWNPFVRPIQYAFGPSTRESEAMIGRQSAAVEGNAEDVQKRAAAEQGIVDTQKALVALKQQSKAEDLDALKPAQRRVEISKEIARLEKEVAAGNKDSQSYLRSWYQQRLQNEREIAAVQKQTAMENIKSAETYLQSIESRIEKIKSQTQSGAERFGRLDAAGQQMLLADRLLVQRGRAGELDAERLDALKGFSDPLDKQISAEFQRRAARGGFGAFARDNNAELRALEAQKKKLELEVKQNIELVAKIDLDVEKVAQEVAKKLRSVNQKAIAEVATRVQQLEGEVTKINSNILRRSVR